MKNTALTKTTHLFEAKYFLVLLTFLLVVVMAANYEEWRGSFFPPAYATVRGEIVKRGVRHGHKSVYVPHLKYRYEVGGKSYENDRISFAPQGGKRKDARLALAHYAEQSSVQVYYDPDNPQFAVLKPESRLAGWQIISLGGLIGADIFLLLYIIVMSCKAYLRREVGQGRV